MMSTRVTVIKERLENAFSPSYLEVVDESDKHLGHAGYQGGNRHFAIVIAAECFRGMTRVATHRQIYALFSDMMPEAIHALKIKVLE